MCCSNQTPVSHLTQIRLLMIDKCVLDLQAASRSFISACEFVNVCRKPSGWVKWDGSSFGRLKSKCVVVRSSSFLAL